MNKLALLVVLLVTACATTLAQPWRIAYSYEDDPSNQRLVLKYENRTSRDVCLTPENWPNQAGMLNQAGDTAYIAIDGARFAISDVNTGYCPGCHFRVRKGKSVIATMPYSHFGIPNRLARRPKTFHFEAFGQECWQGVPGTQEFRGHEFRGHRVPGLR